MCAACDGGRYCAFSPNHWPDNPLLEYGVMGEVKDHCSLLVQDIYSANAVWLSPLTTDNMPCVCSDSSDWLWISFSFVLLLRIMHPQMDEQ